MHGKHVIFSSLRVLCYAQSSDVAQCDLRMVPPQTATCTLVMYPVSANASRTLVPSRACSRKARRSVDKQRSDAYNYSLKLSNMVCVRPVYKGFAIPGWHIHKRILYLENCLRSFHLEKFGSIVTERKHNMSSSDTHLTVVDTEPSSHVPITTNHEFS